MDKLKHFFNSYSGSGQKEAEEAWCVLGQLDVARLDKTNFLPIYDFWCEFASILSNNKICITPKLILGIIRSSIVSLQLCKKSAEFGVKSSKAVESVLGMNYCDMFNELEFVEFGLVETQKDLKGCLHFLELILAKLEPNAPSLINLTFWILDFSLKCVEFNDDNETADYIRENSRKNLLENLPNEIKDLDELKTDIEPLYYLIVRYLFEKETGIKVSDLIDNQSFFNDLIQNNTYENNAQYAFLYYKTEPISLFESVLSDGIDYRLIILFALSNLIEYDDIELILNSISVQINPNTAFFYMFSQNIEMESFIIFLENILLNDLPKEWRDFIDFIFAKINIPKPMKLLLMELNENVKSAAVELSKNSQSLPYIDHSKNHFSKILFHILTKDIFAYDKKNFDIFTVIEIWKLINTNKMINFTELFAYLYNVLKSETIKLFENNLINTTAALNNCIPLDNKLSIDEKKYENIVESFFEDFNSVFELINLCLFILLSSTNKIENIILEPFLKHFLISNENKKIIKEKFNVIFSYKNVFEDFKSVYQSIEENDKGMLITTFTPMFNNVEFTNLALKLFNEEKNYKSFELFFNIEIDFCDYFLNTMEKDYFFNLILGYASSNCIYKFISNLIINGDEEYIFTKLGEYGYKYPTKIKNLLKRISPNNDQLSLIMKHVVKIGDSVSSELIELLIFLTAKHKDEKYINPPEIINNKSISCNWPEDDENNKEIQDIDKLVLTGDVNPWVDDKEIGECTFLTTKKKYVDQHWFYCYTCGLTSSTGCCLACAYKCHKGHKLVYSRRSLFYCDCYESGKCLFNQQKIQKCTDNKSLPLELPTNTVLDLFTKIINCDYIKENEKGFNKFNEFFSESLEQVNTVNDETQFNIQKKDIDFPNQNNLFSTMSSIFEGDLVKLLERFLITPILLSCVCDNMLLFSVGNTLHLYSNDFHLLNTIELESPALRVLASPDNNSIFAASSTTQLFILSIENSTINKIKTIHIPLLITYEWVPKEDTIVVLTEKNLIVINNVMNSENLIYYKFSCKRITSFTIIPYEDKTYCVYISNNGKYGYFIINSQEDKKLQFEYTFKDNVDSIIISYSHKSKIIFFSCSEKNLLYAINVHDFFENKRNKIKINMNKSLNLMFIGLHPKNPFIHIFQHVSSCALFAVKFNEKYIDFIQISQHLSNSTLPLLECDMSNLACFVLNGNQYFIDQSGEFYQIEDVDEEETSINTIHESPYCVPHSFWTFCYESNDLLIHASSNCSIKSEEGLNNIFFSNNEESMYLKICSTTEKDIIVGFIIYPSCHKNSNYYCYKINNRYYQGSETPTMIPLKPSEIGVQKTYTIEFENSKNDSIRISNIIVYAINQNTLSPAIFENVVDEKDEIKNSNDWENDGKTIFDYIDIDITDFSDKKHNILYNLSRTVTGEIDEDKTREIITYIYKYPEYSNYCRSIVLKSYKDNKERLLEIWKDTIIHIVQNKLPCDWAKIWRDIYVMPPDKRSEILSKIWDCNPQVEGDFAIIDSFIQ